MPEYKENNDATGNKNAEKIEKKKSFRDTIREIDEQERKEELEQAALKAEIIAEKERLQRGKYEKSLAKERIELMKLKSGIIADIPKEEKEEKIYTRKEKIANFFFHYKTHLIVSAFLIGLAVFFVYDMVTKVNPDVSVMIIATDSEFYYYSKVIESVLEQYCEDFNGDGNVKVQVNYTPAAADISDSTAIYYTQADQAKLAAEFQAADTILIIADEETCNTIGVTEGVFKDLSDIYPENEGVNNYRYMLNATSIAEDIEYPELAGNLFVAFREPREGIGINEKKFITNFNSALKLWDNYISGNIQNNKDELK